MNDQQTIESAIIKCHNAWANAINTWAKTNNRTQSPFDLNPHCRHQSGMAYRQALPYLSSPINIDAFIACVSHGQALGAIDKSDATKLLYGAQVAITSRRAQFQQSKTQQPVPHLGSARVESNFTS